MKAITLWQPWASLCVTRQACLQSVHPPDGVCRCERPSVKWIETRSWPAPAGLVGERLLLHAAAKRPAGPLSSIDVGSYRVRMRPDARVVMRGSGMSDDIDLPLGEVVGSAVLDACVPIVDPGHPRSYARRELAVGKSLILWDYPDPTREVGSSWVDVSDQLPYGDFAPGRWAWILRDAAPTTDRCPACWGGQRSGLDRCRVCDDAFHCPPIPWKGRQRVWECAL